MFCWCNSEKGSKSEDSSLLLPFSHQQLLLSNVALPTPTTLLTSLTVGGADDCHLEQPVSHSSSTWSPFLAILSDRDLISSAAAFVSTTVNNSRVILSGFNFDITDIPAGADIEVKDSCSDFAWGPSAWHIYESIFN